MSAGLKNKNIQALVIKGILRKHIVTRKLG